MMVLPAPMPAVVLNVWTQPADLETDWWIADGRRLLEVFTPALPAALEALAGGRELGLE